MADAIAKGILMRRYTVGQRLVEADLTRELGVSRSTVREALRILAGSGVVELMPHRGAAIRALSRTDAESLLQVLEVLTGLAARLAARRIAEGDNRARFQAAAERLLAPREADDLAQVLDERARFYKAMFDIAGNAELDRALPLPRAHLFRTQFYHHLTRADLRAMLAEYRAIAESILQGDEAKAETRMRRHLRKTGERTVPLLDPHPAG